MTAPLPLLIISLFLNSFLLGAYVVLARYTYRILPKLWGANTRVNAISFFKSFPPKAGDWLFVGDTHVQDYHWNEISDGARIRNLGLADETTAILLERIEDYLHSKPERIYLQIGGSDIRQHRSVKATVSAYEQILILIRQVTPKTVVIMQSVLPAKPTQARQIQAFNEHLVHLAKRFDHEYVDIFAVLADEHGALSKRYSNDGYHLLASGYEQWIKLLDLT